LKLLPKILGGVLAAYGLVVLGMYVGQRRLLYFPDPNRVTPAARGLTGVEERELKTADGERVIAWYGKASAGAPTFSLLPWQRRQPLGAESTFRAFHARRVGCLHDELSRLQRRYWLADGSEQLCRCPHRIRRAHARGRHAGDVDRVRRVARYGRGRSDCGGARVSRSRPRGPVHLGRRCCGRHVSVFFRFVRS
jgi:hypothetical protein